MKVKQKVLAYSAHIAILSSILFSPYSNAANYDLLEPPKTDLFESSGFFIQNLAEEKEGGYVSILKKIKKKETGEARQEILDALKKSPIDPTLYNFLGVIDAGEKKYNAAKKNYLKAIEIDENYTAAYLGLAEIAIFEKQFNQAKKYYAQLIRINSNNYGAYIVLARLLYKEGDTKKAVESLLKGYRGVEGSVGVKTRLLEILGQLYVVEKQPEKFLSLAQGLAKRYPGNSSVLSVLADAQLSNGEKKDAEKTLFKVISIEPQNVKQRVMLVKLLGSQTGKEKQAIEQLDRLIALNPNKLQLMSLKVDYLIRIKRFNTALTVASEVHNKFPKQELGSHLSGDIYRAEKDFKKALDAYRQAYHIEPRENTLFLIADILVKQGKQMEVIELLESELKKRSEAFGIHLYLANLYLAKSDFDKAEVHFERVLSQNPNNVLGLNNLAWLYLQKGEEAKALPLAKKAFELAPKDVNIADTYSSILLKNGNRKKANAVLKSVSK